AVVGGMGRVERVQLGVAERNREATQATGGGEIAGDGDVDRRVTDAAQAVLVLVLRLLGAVEREPGAARGGGAGADPAVEVVEGRRHRVAHGHGGAGQD